MKRIRDHLQLLWRHSARATAWVTGLLLGSTLVQGFSLALLVPLLGLVGLELGDEGALASVARGFAGGFAALGLTPSLPLVLGVYVLAVAVQAGLSWAQGVQAQALIEHLSRTLREELFGKVLRAESEAWAQVRGTDLPHVLLGEVGRVSTACSWVIRLATQGLLTLVYFALALLVAPAPVLLTAGVGAVLVLGLRRWRAQSLDLGMRTSKVQRGFHDVVGQLLGSLRLVRAFGREDATRERFAGLTRESRDVMVGLQRAHATASALFQVGAAATLAAVVYVAVEVAEIPLAALLLVIFVFARLLGQVRLLHTTYQVLQGSLPALGSVREFETQLEQAMRNAPAPESAPAFGQTLAVDGLDFSYPDGTQALQGVSLAIERGRLTAIVGPSGAGKTTLVDVLIGLYTPGAGELRVDGQPLRPAQLTDWRRRVGYVPQDAFFFHDTLRENLLWAVPDADEPALRAALEQAEALTFVDELPDGLDTVLGDRGVRLSGGQRQRLALARALLRQPDLLVLDEATSALDLETEAALFATLERIKASTAVVLVTHRLGSVRGADVIHVLDAGRCVESGSWEELIGAGGRLAALEGARG